MLVWNSIVEVAKRQVITWFITTTGERDTRRLRFNYYLITSVQEIKCPFNGVVVRYMNIHVSFLFVSAHCTRESYCNKTYQLHFILLNDSLTLFRL